MGTYQGRDGGNGPVAPRNPAGAPTPQREIITNQKETETEREREAEETHFAVIQVHLG